MRKRLGLVGVAGSVALTVLALITGSISDLVGAATFLFSAGFRRWVEANFLPVFWVGAALAICLVTYSVVLRRALADEKARVAELTQGHQTTLAERQGRIESVSADLELARAEIIRLKAEPTPHDCDLFRRFLDDFPPDEGTVEYLTKWFSGESWNLDKLNPLYNFYATWGLNTFFDDDELQRALENLYDRCTDFRLGIASESFLDPDDPRDGTRALKRDRFKSDRQFDAKARELVGLADRLLEAHDSLVRLGRRKRLYRSKADAQGSSA